MKIIKSLEIDDTTELNKLCSDVLKNYRGVTEASVKQEGDNFFLCIEGKINPTLSSDLKLPKDKELTDYEGLTSESKVCYSFNTESIKSFMSKIMGFDGTFKAAVKPEEIEGQGPIPYIVYKGDKSIEGSDDASVLTSEIISELLYTMDKNDPTSEILDTFYEAAMRIASINGDSCLKQEIQDLREDL